MENSSTAAEHKWMTMALQLATHAQRNGEVPVGAVLVRHDQVIGEGWNQPIHSQDATSHAEIVAIREASRASRNYRLNGSTIYITLEPCMMCVGAIIQARIQRVVFGAFDNRFGIVDWVAELYANKRLNHFVEFKGGVLEAQCGTLLSDFFATKRSE